MPAKTKKAEPEKSGMKQLYRSDTDKVIAGVAGGLAAYFNIDSVIVRIIFILLAVYGGSGIFIYFILWILIPKKSQTHDDTNKTIKQNIEEMKQTAKNFSHKNDSRQLVGIFLLGFGLLFLLDNFGVIDVGAVWRFWPLLLIISGYLILTRNDRQK